MLKKSKKKARGIEARIAREEFLCELKNPTPKQDESAQGILEKIRNRKQPGRIHPYPKKNISPYDAGPDGAMGSLLKKLRSGAGLK